MNKFFITIIIFLIFATKTAFSCSCIGESIISVACDNSDILVIGKIISKEINTVEYEPITKIQDSILFKKLNYYNLVKQYKYKLIKQYDF